MVGPVVDISADEFRLPGDITAVEVAGVDELVAVIVAWGACPGGRRSPGAADLNGDGVVNVDNLLIVIMNWT